MRIGVGAPLELTGSSGVRALIGNVTSEAWLTAKTDGHYAPRTVSDWTWDPTHTILTLTLRNDVYFHDGTRLTADLAAEGLGQHRANARQERSLGFVSVESVDAAGPDKVVLRLSEPNSFVLNDLSAFTVKLPSNPAIATGPFMETKRDQQQVSLSAFPKYYRGRPGLGGIDIIDYRSQRNAWAALMRGDIDMLYEVSPDAADFVSAESTVHTYTFERSYYVALVFNVRHAILRKVQVRRAINEAVDRPTLVRDGMNSRGRPADGPIWPEHWARPATRPQFTYDPDDARRLLDSAGLKATRSAGGSMPSRFSFTCLVYAEDARFERLAFLVQKQLADVGIEMKLKPLKANEIGDPLRTGDFDAVFFEFFGRSLSFTYQFWHHEGALINGGYVAADGALDRIRGARSDEETKAAVADLTRVMFDDPPAAFLAWQQTSRAVSTRFDVAAEQGRDILSSIWQWRSAPPAQHSQ